MSNYRTGNDYWVAIGQEYATETDINAGYGTGKVLQSANYCEKFSTISDK
jgi:hypothetical protein